MADKTNERGKNNKNKFNIFYYIKSRNKGGSSIVELNSKSDQGKKVSKRKATEHVDTVVAFLKWHRDSDVGAILPGNAMVPEECIAMVPKECTLSAKLLETDSAFESASVARKIASGMLAPADKDKLNTPCYVNSSASVHHAYLALMHALKTDEQARAEIKKVSDFQEQNFQLKEKVKKMKNIEAEVKDLRAEVASLKKKLAEAEIEKGRAVREARSNFQRTPEFVAAAKEANKEAVIGTFGLCLDEVRYVYPDLDLSMVSLKNLKTAHAYGVEGDTTTLAAEVNAVSPTPEDGTELCADGIRGDATS
ncbi:hypothetical protein CCACVL1_02318 [Corchorus capsularis]|uniref:Uncharacterized protein n=1 Tax=Corchorus capsularis TaxID=210143 RepID=A0A1R3K9C5_COCAP|nr:hypothetical protein CCACVL1_02318 [Corchorus capsularis]